MKTIEVDELTYKRLCVFSEMENVEMAEAITMLVDFQQIPSVRPGPDYVEWLQKLIDIGKDGEEAALEYMRNHPYGEADHG